MDLKMCESSKRLNALQHDRKKREEQLDQLTADLEGLKLVNTSEYDPQREQVRLLGSTRLFTEMIRGKLSESTRLFTVITEAIFGETKIRRT